MRVLTDADVVTVDPEVAVDAAREALRRFASGELAAPPRVSAELGDLDYYYTTGGLSGGVSGFRAYRAGTPAGDQLVALWDAAGSLFGIVVGDELGARRTGALGGAAVAALTTERASTLAVIGTGKQAWTQVWACGAVRSPELVRVHSRDERNREVFAAEVRDRLGLRAETVATPDSAVRDAEVIVLATRSESPVIDSADIAPGAHVTTVGPKGLTRHEMPPELLERAAIVTCDSPRQAAALPEFLVDPTRLVSLGDVLIGTHPGRESSEQLTVHCSVGLAGSEVLFADRLFGAISG
ncbi:ornithine cyclodeaminase family protein [Actinopolyspora sp. H202]|uniref:ornithine cyclodeaminase family protein n=1 Tax=Actinopolyspora sp. H202 TaxID=1500456 RepID=UPI003EE81DB4